MKQLTYLCKCNNCENLYSENFIHEDSTLSFGEYSFLEQIVDEDGDVFWGCPECDSEEYLISYDDDNAIKIGYTLTTIFDKNGMENPTNLVKIINFIYQDLYSTKKDINEKTIKDSFLNLIEGIFIN